MGNNVTSIEGSAFENCFSLKSIIIPKSVTRINSQIFQGCGDMQKLTLPFIGREKKSSSDTYQYPLGYIFGTNEYQGGVATTQAFFQSSTTSVDNQTYYIPKSLTEVVVLGGDILRGAFDDCVNIETIILEDGVSRIEEHAFWNCKGLTAMTIPTSVSYLGGWAFAYCSSLKTITYKGTLSQWKALVAKSDRSYLGINSGVEKIVCSNGSITVG